MQCLRNYGVIDDTNNIEDHGVQVKNVDCLTKTGYASKVPFRKEIQ